MFFGLLIAFGLGTLHALFPGHSKIIVGAYLVGSRGTFKHVVFLGAAVTITHIIGSFCTWIHHAFCLKVCFARKNNAFPLVCFRFNGFFIGIPLFKSRLSNASGWCSYTNFPHHSDRFHRHNHSHDHHDRYVNYGHRNDCEAHRLIESSNHEHYTAVKHSYNYSSVKITQAGERSRIEYTHQGRNHFVHPHLHYNHAHYEHHHLNGDCWHCRLHDLPTQKEAKVKTSYSNLTFTHARWDNTFAFYT